MFDFILFYIVSEKKVQKPSFKDFNPLISTESSHDPITKLPRIKDGSIFKKVQNSGIKSCIMSAKAYQSTSSLIIALLTMIKSKSLQGPFRHIKNTCLHIDVTTTWPRLVWTVFNCRFIHSAVFYYVPCQTFFFLFQVSSSLNVERQIHDVRKYIKHRLKQTLRNKTDLSLSMPPHN